MTTGKVKWFDDVKGFGFILSDLGDVFVHYSVVQFDGYRTLGKGQEVTYEIGQHASDKVNNGRSACNVVPVGAYTAEDHAAELGDKNDLKYRDEGGE